MRAWGRALAVLVTAVTMTGGTTTAGAEAADRLTGADAAHAEAGDVGTTAIVPLPDLAITHRLPSGAMNLWRMPLSELEAGTGQPQLVKNLDYGGFSYGNSRTLAGDFADVTPSDDGTADHVIWHRQPNGGVLLWAVGGGGDTTPRLWQDLRTGGWSWTESLPSVGDVNGDGWDDLVVQHRNGYSGNSWVFYSDGIQLGEPQLWGTTNWGGSSQRFLVGDLNSDGLADLADITTGPHQRQTGLNYGVILDGYYGFRPGRAFSGATSSGWSFSGSRQLAGDVTGDGRTDLVTVHAQAGGGVLVWMHRSCISATTPYCFQEPVVWQDLRSGGWSFAGSRQHLADTNGDGIDDLISVHSQSGNPGILVWRHLSTGQGFRTPQVVADLRSGGWSYAASRESVADTYGVF